MKNPLRSARLLAAFCLGLFSLLPAFGQTGLVISQIFGGGGNSGASFNADFVEIYNPTSAAISTSGLSVQYASAAGNFGQPLALATASIPPQTYFLVQTTAAGTTGASLPTPDTSGTAPNLSATIGKVALVNGTAALSTDTTCALILADTRIIDFVGYGSTASCYKGSGPAPTTPNNATSIIRKVSGTNTNDNAADFTTSSPITPRNSGAGVVTPPTAPTVAIHDIQGVKSTTSMTVSPYAGQQVTTSGVVTAVLSNAFFLQASDANADSNLLTPEGIEVFTSTKPTVIIGNAVTVTGTVQTYPAVTASHTPATEITSPTVTLTAAVAALPTPITLTTAMLTAGGGLYQLTPYEGMRVSVPSMTAVSGTNGSITSANEPAELATSTGYFYAVIGNTARPFREPGVDIRDAAVPGLPAGVAKFDDNPERILVDSTIAGGTSLEIATGAVMTNVTGVLDFTFSSDSFYDPSRLILDATYPRTSVTGGMTVQAVALPASNEFTVASFNIERFYNTSSADDLYYVPAGVNGYNGSSGSAIVSTGQTFISAAADNTPAAYARRLTKLSLAIRTVLNSPDIVTIEEVENQSVANDIAAQINTDAGVPNLYTAYSTDNQTFYTQDGTGISVGFLVKNTVDNLGVTQYGAGETFTPTSGSLTTLNDRPWLVLSAGIKRATGIKDYPVTVVVNHMKALTGQNSATTNSTRLKKELQAEDIAKFIQTQQAAGKHVISGGDFNAFEFSDGYNDTLGTYTNTNVLPATQVLQPGVAGLVTPPLTDLALTLPATQRWSYVEDGSAQILDHMVVTPELVTAGAHFAYGHMNADFPLTSYNDATTAARNSDHDPAIGYFVIPAPVLSATLTPNPAAAFASTTVGATSTGQVFTITNTGEGPIGITSVSTTSDFAVTSACGASLAISTTCTVNVVFSPTAAGTRTGTLTAATSNGNLTVALTGTGISPALDALTPATQSFGSVALGTSSAVQVFTLANTGGTASTITSVTVTGDFAKTAATTCAASLAPSSSCTISVVFTPTALGARTGTLTVVATGGTGLVSTLTGTGAAPATLTPATATFASTIMGKTSAATPFTVTNTSGAAITLAAGSVVVTGDFTQTNTCGSGLAAGATCIVNVVFAPTVAGARTGVLTVTPAVGGVSTALTASLSGTGLVPPDFTFQASASSGTVASPITAFTSITLTSVGGYTGTLTFSCAGAPTNSTCTVAPSTVVLGSGSTTVSVTITTAAYKSAGSTSLLLGSVVSLMALGVLFARRRGAVRIAGLMSLLLVISLYTTGCGSSSVFSKAAPGTYTYNIVATDGTTSHTVPYTLTIQ